LSFFLGHLDKEINILQHFSRSSRPTPILLFEGTLTETALVPCKSLDSAFGKERENVVVPVDVFAEAMDEEKEGNRGRCGLELRDQS
jgi:hypothetical protein